MKIDEKVVEKVFSTPVRLKIVAALIARSPLIFSEIISELELTRGNLSSHMKQLESNGFVEVKKEFVNNRPQTSYDITPEGRAAFEQYVKLLESIISSSKE